MDRHVKIHKISFGERIFIHRSGAIREVEYRGLVVKDIGTLRSNIIVKYIFWFGKESGEDKIDADISLYKNIEDATQESNPIPYETLDMESFSLKYLPHLIWNGIQFYGWLWNGSKPEKRATREPLRACEIYNGEVTFIDYQRNMYDAEHFQKFYQTAEECRKANKPKIVMLDKEEDDFVRQKRNEFYEYVKHYCPGFEDKINWECFQGNNTMPWNLAEQVRKIVTECYSKDVITKTKSKEVYDSIICMVDSRRGAPMGMANIGDRKSVKGQRIYCRKVPLTHDGAYDKGGAYWGIGYPLYVEYTLDKSYVRFFRKEP